ncbi:hypothetical protein [Pedobacter immunditicola]|uniref:hypothetical protein n=1 Tax=Pedobacter immunditicola TaxID=3133440 RepID=UPI0030A68A45
MKVFKIFILFSAGLFAFVINSKAQSKLSVTQEPQTNKENIPALKMDTGSCSNDFVIKPRYGAHRGAPVKIPNGYKPSDDTVFNMPIAKINPFKQVILPTITIKKVPNTP